MKKMIFAFLCGSLFLTSCKDSNISPTPSSVVSAANVPVAVLTTLSKTYPTATATTWNKTAPTTYLATFKLSSTASSAKTATIQNTGALLKVGNVIDPATLPTVITDYLKANYAGYIIVQADAKVNAAGAITGYETLINVGTVQYELEFGPTGIFTKLETPDGHAEGNGIAQASLLPVITTYLTTTYPGYVFKEAETKLVNGVLTGYKVEIVQNNLRYNVLFDTAGVFVSVNAGGNGGGEGGGNDGNGGNHGIDTAIAQSALPATVGTFLTTNYAGYVYVSSVVEKDAAGTVLAYEVIFTSAGVTYEAEFNALGVFVKLNNGGDKNGDGD